MKNLSEILNELENLIKEYNYILETMEEGSDKDATLEYLDVAIDCLDISLMYGDFINDTGKDYNYYEE